MVFWSNFQFPLHARRQRLHCHLYHQRRLHHPCLKITNRCQESKSSLPTANPLSLQDMEVWNHHHRYQHSLLYLQQVQEYQHLLQGESILFGEFECCMKLAHQGTGGIPVSGIIIFTHGVRASFRKSSVYKIKNMLQRFKDQKLLCRI